MTLLVFLTRIQGSEGEIVVPQKCFEGAFVMTNIFKVSYVD